MAVILFFGITFTLPLSLAAHATSTTFPNETFRGTSTAVGGDWIAGGSGSPCLTAAASSTPSGIPGCSATPLDSPGAGVLRLTPKTLNASSYVVTRTPMALTDGLDVSFDTYQWGGNGADGLAFFLADGSSPFQTRLAVGGTLGYKSSVAHGLVGVGFDSYGSFGSPPTTGGCAAVPGVANGSRDRGIAIRSAGNGASGYCVLARTAYNVRSSATIRPTPVSARIVIDPASTSPQMVRVYVGGVLTVQANAPAELHNATSAYVGFSATTGGLVDYHEISSVAFHTVTPTATTTTASTTTTTQPTTSTTTPPSTTSTSPSTSIATTTTTTTTSTASTSSTTTAPSFSSAPPATATSTTVTPTITTSPTTTTTRPGPANPVAVSRSSNVLTDPNTGAISMPRRWTNEFDNADKTGFYRTNTDGSIQTFGTARNYGSMAGRPLNAAVVSGTACGDGYWLAAADGGVFTFGDLAFYGSMASHRLNEPVVAIIASPSCKGYWLLAADGGVFAYGDAPFFGSIASQRRNDVFGFLFYGSYYCLVLEDGTVVLIKE